MIQPKVVDQLEKWGTKSVVLFGIEVRFSFFHPFFSCGWSDRY